MCRNALLCNNTDTNESFIWITPKIHKYFFFKKRRKKQKNILKSCISITIIKSSWFWKLKDSSLFLDVIKEECEGYFRISKKGYTKPMSSLYYCYRFDLRR
jgi:hypothetical protein